MLHHCREPRRHCDGEGTQRRLGWVNPRIHEEQASRALLSCAQQVAPVPACRTAGALLSTEDGAVVWGRPHLEYEFLGFGDSLVIALCGAGAGRWS